MIDKNDPRLTAYLFDELDAEDVAQIESAIRESDDLREHVEALRETIGVLHRAAATAPDSESLSLTASQIDSIESAAVGVQGETQSESVSKHSDGTAFPSLETTDSPSRFRWQNFAIAALVLYVVGISLFTLRGPADPVATSTTDITARMEAGGADDAGANLYEMIADVPEPVELEPTGDGTNELSNRTNAVARDEDAKRVEDTVRAFELLSDADVPVVDTPPVAFPESAEQWDSIHDRRIRGMRENYALTELEPAVIPPADSVIPDVSEFVESETVVSGEVGGRSMTRQRGAEAAPSLLPKSPASGAGRPRDQFGVGGDTRGSDTIGWDGFGGTSQSSMEMDGGMEEMTEEMMMMEMGSGMEDYAMDSGGMMGGGGRGGTRRLGGDLDTGATPMRIQLRRGEGRGRGVATPGGEPSRRARTPSDQFGEEMPAEESPVDFADARDWQDVNGAATERSDSLKTRLADSNSVRNNESEKDRTLGDVDVRFIPELGQVIVQGSPRDVARVKELISEIESQSMTNEFKTELAELSEDEKKDLDRLEEVRDKISERLSKERKLSEKPKSNKQAKEGKPAKKNKPKTWKPATASTNRARLSVGHHDDLVLTARDTYVRIDGFRARVFFDCYYFNDRPQQLEGQFMLRLPNDASLHYFAFGPTNLTIPDPPRATGKGGQQPARQPAEQSTARDTCR